MPKVATQPTRVFEGFDRRAPQFFAELAAEMNREWFEANKQRYLEDWVQPLTALLEQVAARLAKAYAPIRLGPPKLFRIYRDTRFAKDKTPYKTHISGMLPLHAGKKPVDGGCSALYWHYGLDEEYAGCGTYFFDDRQLVRWRKLVAADRTGKEIASIIRRLRNAGYRVGGHDDYKKVPKGFAPDHPREELLRMRGLTAGFPEMPRGILHKPELVDWLVTHVRATAPLVTWLYRNVKA
jgi:uncharacterized protein (TIGR02453 family)